MKMTDDLFKGCGVAITLKNDEDFLLIKETLSRIGVASRKEKVLYPSVCILHRRGYYRLMHFKEMFKLDGKPSDISENDLARRNTIALLLKDWDLVELSDENVVKGNVVNLNQIKILSFKEKPEWQICHKYTVGSRKKEFNK